MNFGVLTNLGNCIWISIWTTCRFNSFIREFLQICVVLIFGDPVDRKVEEIWKCAHTV